MLSVHASQSGEGEKNGKKWGEVTEGICVAVGRMGIEKSPGAWGGDSAYVNFTVAEVDQEESLDYGHTLCNFKLFVFWDANPLYHPNWIKSITCSHFGGVGTKEFIERSWLPF